MYVHSESIQYDLWWFGAFAITCHVLSGIWFVSLQVPQQVL